MARRIREEHHPRENPREQVAFARTTTPRNPWVREGGCNLAIARQHPAFELLFPVDGLASELVVGRIRVGEELRREEAPHAKTLERAVQPAKSSQTATPSRYREPAAIIAFVFAQRGGRNFVGAEASCVAVHHSRGGAVAFAASEW